MAPFIKQAIRVCIVTVLGTEREPRDRQCSVFACAMNIINYTRGRHLGSPLGRNVDPERTCDIMQFGPDKERAAHALEILATHEGKSDGYERP